MVHCVVVALVAGEESPVGALQCLGRFIPAPGRVQACVDWRDTSAWPARRALVVVAVAEPVPGQDALQCHWVADLAFLLRPRRDRHRRLLRAGSSNHRTIAARPPHNNWRDFFSRRSATRNIPNAAIT